MSILSIYKYIHILLYIKPPTKTISLDKKSYKRLKPHKKEKEILNKYSKKTIKREILEKDS